MVIKKMERGGEGFNGFQVQEAEIRTLLRQREALRSANEDLIHSKESCEMDCIRKTKKDPKYKTCLLYYRYHIRGIVSQSHPSFERDNINFPELPLVKQVMQCFFPQPTGGSRQN